MASTFRLLRNFLRRDSAERLQAMREDAAADPEGVACWMASVALWEEGQIAEAHRMAESLLRSEPADFRMLVICLDWSIRCRDPDRILAFAKLVAEAKNPARSQRRVYAVASIVLWPLWLLGYGRGLLHEADALETWGEWARAYVRDHAHDPSGSNISPERTRELGRLPQGMTPERSHGKRQRSHVRVSERVT